MTTTRFCAVVAALAAITKRSASLPFSSSSRASVSPFSAAAKRLRLRSGRRHRRSRRGGGEMRVEEGTVIRRPVEDVFAFAADPKKDPLWASAVAESGQIPEEPLDVGTRFRRCFGSCADGSRSRSKSQTTSRTGVSGSAASPDGCAPRVSDERSGRLRMEPGLRSPLLLAGAPGAAPPRASRFAAACGRPAARAPAASGDLPGGEVDGDGVHRLDAA